MLTALWLGAIAGMILALTGAGGGILAVPLLMFGAGLDIISAGPIALLAVGLAAALGAALGWKAGLVRYRAAFLIAACGMVFAPLGIWGAHTIPTQWLSTLFSLFLFHAAWRNVRRPSPANSEYLLPFSTQPRCVRSVKTGHFIWTTSCARALAFSGGITGLFNGLLGVGGGFVLVPALQRFTDLSMLSIVPTSLAAIAIVSLMNVMLSLTNGNLDWSIGMPFTTGALAGMAIGRYFSSLINARHLQDGFAMLAVATGIWISAKALGLVDLYR